jgi:hypothetical protein
MITKQQLEHFNKLITDISSRHSTFKLTDLKASEDFKQVSGLNHQGDSIPVCILPSFPYDSNNQATAQFIASSHSDLTVLLGICKALIDQYTAMEQGLIESMRLQKTEFDAIAQIQSRLTDASSMLEGMKKLLINTNEFANSKFNK